MNKFRVGICQIKTTTIKKDNLNRAWDLLKKCKENKADVFILGENFNCPYGSTQNYKDLEQFEDYTNNIEIEDAINSQQNPTIKFLQQISKDLNIFLIAGSIPIQRDSKVYNTTLIYNNGVFLDKYEKLHCFDVNIPGKVDMKESSFITKGNKIKVLDTKYGKFGFGICYDLRFCSFAMAMRQLGADVLFYPSVFTETTGSMHFSKLGMARGLDTQCHVVLCSNAKNIETGMNPSYGHSQVIDFNGNVLQSLQQEEGFFVQEIDLDKQNQMRQQLPYTNYQQRTDIYKIFVLVKTQNNLKFYALQENIPAPEKAQTGGEDAFYSDENLLVVADGVGGWNRYGIDPSKYSRRLVQLCQEGFKQNPILYSKEPQQLCIYAGTNNNEIGSSTLVIATLDPEQQKVNFSNLGDSGFAILRLVNDEWKMIERSIEQLHGFNFPFQIGSSGDSPDTGENFSYDIQEDDIVLLGSDGLFDNMYDRDIVRIFNEVQKESGFNLKQMLEFLSVENFQKSIDKQYFSPFAENALRNKFEFMGGKSDDISIILARIVQKDFQIEKNNNESVQQNLEKNQQDVLNDSTTQNKDQLIETDL